MVLARNPIYDSSDERCNKGTQINYSVTVERLYGRGLLLAGGGFMCIADPIAANRVGSHMGVGIKRRNPAGFELTTRPKNWPRLSRRSTYTVLPINKLVRELWSSGYGRRLMIWRSWVWIPALFTGWTFFTFICCIYCDVSLKRKK